VIHCILLFKHCILFDCLLCSHSGGSGMPLAVMVVELLVLFHFEITQLVLFLALQQLLLT